MFVTFSEFYIKEADLNSEGPAWISFRKLPTSPAKASFPFKSFTDASRMIACQAGNGMVTFLLNFWKDPCVPSCHSEPWFVGSLWQSADAKLQTLPVQSRFAAGDVQTHQSDTWRCDTFWLKIQTYWRVAQCKQVIFSIKMYEDVWRCIKMY